MKKTLPILTFLLIILLGCTTERIVYVNRTIVYNNTITKEIKVVEYINITPECRPCKKITCPKIDNTCQNKLNLCYIRLDYQSDLIFDCLKNNNTEYMENITVEYDACVRDRDVCSDKLDNISGIID